VVPAVVRRVDDALVLPAAPRVAAGRAERCVAGGSELVQLGPPLGHPRRGLRERLATAGADLDLGSHQLADEGLLHPAPAGGFLELLEAVRELERLGVEDRELLLDRDGEVASVLVRLVRRTNLLVRAELLRVAHGAPTLLPKGAVPPRPPSSSARPPRGAR